MVLSFCGSALYILRSSKLFSCWFVDMEQLVAGIGGIITESWAVLQLAIKTDVFTRYIAMILRIQWSHVSTAVIILIILCY